MSELDNKIEGKVANPNILNQGGTSVAIGLGILVGNLLISQIQWLFLIVGILLIGGFFYLAYKKIFRVASFFMLIAGATLVLKNVFFIGAIIDIFIYLSAIVMILVGGWGIYRYYSISK